MTELAMGFPQVYRQGAGLINRLGEAVSEFGTNAVVVADAIVRDLLEDRIVAGLSRSGVKVHMVEFSGECSPSAIEAITAFAREVQGDVVVGVGGGKALDTAKGVKRELDIPVIIVPTIASNDAPTSRVIPTYEEDGRFIGPRFLKLNPEAVLVDTEVIANAPSRFLSSGIGDTLLTWFEAEQCYKSGVENFFHGRPTETAMNMAHTSYRLVREYGPAAVKANKEKRVTPALEKVVEANVLLSGLGFEGCGVAGAHAVAQGFTLVPSIKATHGEEVAVGLIVQFVMEDRDEDFIMDMLDFYDLVDLPSRLTDIGLKELTEEALDTIVTFACRENSRMYNMAMPISIDFVKRAVRKADELAAAHHESR